MKFRFPLSLPNRADGTLLPGILVALLAAALGVQLWAANAEPDLPPVLAVGATRLVTAIPTIAPVKAARVIFDRPLFAPRQAMTAATGFGQPLVLGGASVAGMVSVRGRSYAVIRRANGEVSNLAIGGLVNGWRLVSLRADGAAFVKDSVRQDIAYGAAAIRPTEEDAPAE